MKLLSMKLTNFKGIRDARFDFPDGGNYNIYGANEAGKSTTFDALTWLLFDKDSSDSKDFSVKTIVDGKPLHHAEHSVECAFLMEDGLRVTLKKVFKEKWQQPRGKLEAEFAGHTIAYFIDEVPMSATKYKEYISGIIDEKRFKTLTNPFYFNEKLKDAERREILMDIIGGVDQGLIIAGNPELKELGNLLKGRKVEDFKLIVKQSLARTKKEIGSIEPAIKEHQAMMISGADAANAGLYDSAKKRANDEIIMVMKEIADAQAGAVDRELEKEIAEARDRIRELQWEDQKAAQEEKNRLDEICAKSLQAHDKHRREYQALLLDKRDLQEKISRCDRTREQLLQEFANTRATSFTEPGIETSCPTCGQELPAEQVEQAKARQEERRKRFMQGRAETLKSIQKRGALNNEAKAELEKQMEEIAAKIETEKAAAEKAQESLDAALYAQQRFSPEANPEIAKLQARAAELVKKKDTPDDTVIRRIGELEARQKEAEARMAEAQEHLNDIAQNQKHQARIMELQKKEKALSATFTELTKQQYLCDQYSRALTDYIDRQIADKFQMARFVMFKDNITNDGAKECCEVQINGVPYHDLNNAKKMNIGLDIIQTLCRKYGVTMPVFIDNAESVTKLIDTDLQVIRLVVSAEDKKLRVEKA